MAPRLQFLRPYTSHALTTSTPIQCSAYLWFYELARAQVKREAGRGVRKYATRGVEEDLSPAQSRAHRALRIAKLKDADELKYPALDIHGKPASIRQFCLEMETVKETEKETEMVSPTVYCVHGRVMRIRQHGPKFAFLDIVHNGDSLQIMLDHGKLEDDTSEQALKNFHALLLRGDHISVTGIPARSKSGVLSLLPKRLPKILSRCLVPLPSKVSQELATHNRHMDILVNPSSREIVILRDLINQRLRSHLSQVLECIEVQTPILAANAGGALARSFTTHASEFPQKDLALRIAPELWLKRLVVAGLDRVFEIGPSFRNEGIDATHNPEFHTCEFYLAHTNLNALLSITQNLFSELAKSIAKHHANSLTSLEMPPEHTFTKDFLVIDFIPTIENALGQPLPDLESETALTDLIRLLDDAGKDWHRSLPPKFSLPKLLDHIAAAVIEPQSAGCPLFIRHHPVCMSPLSRSFYCAKTGQHVAARAELFYNGIELANMYEEENDPFKQRDKFIAQNRARVGLLRRGEVAPDDTPAHVIDEQYISVLETGLPPTGGWGCGIDRLVMLFSGAKRICDVQPFGSLRHVVGLASTGTHISQQHGDDVDLVKETQEGAAGDGTA